MAPSLKMERTQTPGIYKRGDRYVVRYRDPPAAAEAFARTLAEARDLRRRR